MKSSTGAARGRGVVWGERGHGTQRRHPPSLCLLPAALPGPFLSPLAFPPALLISRALGLPPSCPLFLPPFLTGPPSAPPPAPPLTPAQCRHLLSLLDLLGTGLEPRLECGGQLLSNFRTQVGL